MPIVYDLRKDIRFKEGLEKGVKKGELKHARLSTIRLLNNGILSVAEIAAVVDMPSKFVLKIQKELEENNNSDANNL